ncbi:MAG: phosphoglycerate dehydrogenase [Trueperaceae bacterium]|nr:phosphoglycerate dehydrogenase [Trueperaceae bacterium]
MKLVQGLMAGVNTLVTAGFGAGVTICNGRGLHDQPVAEHTVALLLAAARRLHLMRDAQHERRWPGEFGGAQPDRDPNVFMTLDASNVTVWGFGSIAARLAPMLSALGANVTGVATAPGTRHGHPVVGPDGLDGLLPSTDALVMILPASEATSGALDARRLRLLPRHAWVVNVGRGNSVNEADLVRALAAGELGGAALDVFAEEPLPAASPLWDLPNVIISPHAAGGRPLGADAFVRENVRRLVRGEQLLNVVDRVKGY